MTSVTKRSPNKIGASSLLGLRNSQENIQCNFVSNLALAFPPHFPYEEKNESAPPGRCLRLGSGDLKSE